MSKHPSFAIGDILLRRHNPFAPSLVVDGYDAVKRMLVWVQPQTDTSGIGPPELYELAPDGWQDAPRAPDECTTPTAWAGYQIARIDWAKRHLARVHEGLAMDELRNAYRQLEELR